MRPISDRSRQFTIGLAISWLALVALPLSLSMLLGHTWRGLPLAGVVLWVVLLRLARWLSPAAHADFLLRRGKLRESLALCERALAHTGSGEWRGPRRMAWLTRRTNALLALGAYDQALTSALEAVEHRADPETLGNVALACLWLNRYDDATQAARQTLALTVERSLSSHAVLAQVALARDLPAEAEALANSGRADAHALLPYVHDEHYALCLAALCRASLRLGRRTARQRYLLDLAHATRKVRRLRTLLLVEQADGLTAAPEERERALALLAEAFELAPNYVLWFLTQPGTLPGLRGDPRLAPAEAKAQEWQETISAGAPDSEVVRHVLETASRDASPKPSSQASRAALFAQVATLAGTLALLVWWMWHFFLSGV
jgi:tetratricopeptide (TPR) repeat protein